METLPTRRRQVSLSAFCVALALLSYSFVAQPTSSFAQPTTIAFQGLLTDTLGVPIDSTVDLLFTLYDTLGVDLWIEPHVGVPVSGGIFSVRLGSVVEFGGLEFGQPLSLGTTVGGESEMTPRTPFDAVPFAFRAAGMVCPTPYCEDFALTTCGPLDCADLTTDRANCGDCGSVCGAGLICSSGTCSLTCQPGLSNCSGKCVDRKGDRLNCGSCGNACDAGNVCAGGVCQLSCQAGLSVCSGVCVNFNSDQLNCGGCSTPCAAGHVCSGGTCSLSCQAGLTKCGSTCVNTENDELHCGGCSKPCTSGQYCSSGGCHDWI